PATLNKDLRHIKAALRTAVEWGYIRGEALPKVRFEPEPEAEPRYMPDGHFTAIYQACGYGAKPAGMPYPAADWWRGLMMFLITTGWRIDQTLHLQRTALDLATETPTAFAPARRTKGKRAVRVPLHPLAVEHLRRLEGPGDLVFPWPHDRRTLDV